MARRLADRSTDADDLVQETVLHALERANLFIDDGSPGHFFAWMATVLKHIHYDRCRKRRHEILSSELDTHADPREGGVPVATWRMIDDDAVDSAVSRLPPTLGNTYVLYVSGLPYNKIASRLDIPLATVGVRIHRARRHLRDVLAPSP